ncbi:MAG TPA: c-type cytochrome domain-containing protein [Terriglobia bacterium]
MTVISVGLRANDATGPTFNSEIAPILQKNCLACHSSAAKMGGLIMDSYGALMKGGAHGQVIVPGQAEASRLVEMLEGKIQPRMPFNSDPLPAADIATIKTWIAGGAKGLAPGEASGNLSAVAIPDIKPQVPVVSPVSSLKFSPDGKLLAIGGYQEVRLIDPASGEAITTLSGHADYVRSIAFSPDGKRLAAAGGACQRSGEIKIWDVASRRLLNTLQGHKDCIYSVAWSPDGKLIASGSYDKMVKIWDVTTGKELRNLQDHIDAVFAVAFSPDGERLASGSQDRTVKIWDVATGERLYTLSDASDGLSGLAYSPSGDQIAAAGYDKTIYVWSLGKDGGRLVHSLIADEDSILALVWSPDGKEIITSSSDGSIRFRDAATLNPISVIDHQPDWVEALGLSPDGKWLAAGRYNGTLSVYNFKTYKPTARPMMAFAPSEASVKAVEKSTASQ